MQTAFVRGHDVVTAGGLWLAMMGWAAIVTACAYEVVARYGFNLPTI
ncbi:MAG: hypothetical protein AAF580_11740 [Pseudomonadota bacterium]